MTTPITCLHRWTTLSRHPTSEGTVIYQRCHCERFRVLREARAVAEHVGGLCDTDRDASA